MLSGRAGHFLESGKTVFSCDLGRLLASRDISVKDGLAGVKEGRGQAFALATWVEDIDLVQVEVRVHHLFYHVVKLFLKEVLRGLV